MSQKLSDSFEPQYHMAWMCRDLAADPNGTYMLVQVALNRLRPAAEKNPTTVNVDELVGKIEEVDLTGGRDKSHWAKEVLYGSLILQIPEEYHTELGRALDRRRSFTNTLAFESAEPQPEQIDTYVTKGFVLAWTLPYGPYGDEKNPSFRNTESGFLFAYSRTPEQMKIKDALSAWKADLSSQTTSTTRATA
jgi:hypothetical protein